MKKFFDPSGIVIVGVSTSLGNLGSFIVANLVRWKFAGKIVCVGRKAGKIFDFPIYASIEEAKAEISGCELAVIITPAPTVIGFLQALSACGITNAIIETGGFAEFSEQGETLAKELKQTIHDLGMRIIGPNCLGLIQLDTGTVTPFANISEGHTIGSNAVIAQSGGVGVSHVGALERMGVGSNWMVSVGNKLDVDEVDIAQFLVENKPVSSVVCYLESIPRGRDLCELAARTDVPIIVHQGNRTPASQTIAQSHTASLASDTKIVEAAFHQAGIIRVATTKDMLNATIASTLPPMKGNRIALLSRSGGHAVLAADVCYEQGLQLQDFSQETMDFIATVHPARVIKYGNPLDLGDIFDFSQYVAITKKVLEQDDIDGVFFIHIYDSFIEGKTSEVFYKKLVDALPENEKPIVFCCVVDEQEFAKVTSLLPYPVLALPEDAAEALGSHFRYCHARSLQEEPYCESLIDEHGDFAQYAHIPVWSLEKSFQLLQQAHIPVAPYSTGLPTQYPVALKFNSDSQQVIHKKSAGLIRLHINDQESYEKANQELRAQGKQQQLFEGTIVSQPMFAGDELFIGAKRDASFGPMVLFGCGGSNVELIGDVQLLSWPFTMGQFIEALHKTKVEKLLGDKLLHDQLAQWLSNLGAVLNRYPFIQEIDVNPIVYQDNFGPRAIDARVIC